MKLLLYSGGHASQNQHLDSELLRLVGKRNEKISLTFVPASSWRVREQFAEFFGDFRRFGVKKTLCLPVDVPIGKKDLDQAFKSDVIYLGGGNTFNFLNNLKTNGFLPKLKSYVKKGGVLAGLSAGAIIMTPNIRMASIPARTADANEIGIKDLLALNLVKFEFHPHYSKKRWENAEISKYAQKLSHPVYACPDGSGIIIESGKISFLGQAYAFIGSNRFAEIDEVQ
jgi:dipeptidase E